MSTTLIVTKSMDESFNETGNQIAMEDWLRIVENDPELKLRTEPYVKQLSNGQRLTVPVLPAQSEILVAGVTIPFLGYRHGELVMKLTDDMENPANPARQKVAKISRQLAALIMHDAGDEILKW